MSKKKQQTRTVKINELNTDVFVRTRLEDDNVQRLCLLIEADTVLDPILITSDMEVIDGRHRIEAQSYFQGMDTIQAKVVEVADRAELIALAFAANSGGSKPPTPADIDHTIGLLLEEGVKQPAIADVVGMTPSQVKKRVAEIRKKATRRKVLAAVHDVVVNEMTAQEAADRHEVDVKLVRAALAGGKGRKKASDARAEKLADIKRLYTTLTRKNGSLLGEIVEAFGDGDAKYSDVVDVLTTLEGIVKRQARTLANWHKRLEAGTAND